MLLRLKASKKAGFTFPALLWATLILAILTVLSIIFIYMYTNPVSEGALSGKQLSGKWLLIDSAKSINPQTMQPLSIYLDQGLSANDINSLDPLRVILKENGIKCAKFTKRTINPSPIEVEIGDSNYCSSLSNYAFKGFVLLPSSFIQLETK